MKSQRQLLKIALSTATLVSTIIAPIVSGLTPASAASVTAKRADAFIDSVCVNTHQWYDWEQTKPKLKELGIRHIRLTPDPALAKELYSYGIKFTMALEGPHFNATDFKNYIKSVGPEKFDSVGGINEPWLFVKSDDWASVARENQRMLWEAIKGDPQLSHIPVSTASPVFPADAQQLGDMSQWADLADIHLYYGGKNPEIKGDQWGTLDWMFRELAGPVAPGKPVIMTETGYHNTKQVDGHTGTPDLGVVAKYIPRVYLTHWMRGIVRSCIYQLNDEGSDPHEQEQNFGLLRHDYSKKPSFEAVKNMIALLKDTGANFTPGSLDYSLAGSTDNVETLLMQKQNGNFFLATWLGVSSFDPWSQSALNVSPQSVTISLPQTVGGVIVHRLSAEGKMTSQNVTVSNGKLQMQVSDAVAFIEIPPSGNTSPNTSPTTPSTSKPTHSKTAVTFYEHGDFGGNSQTFSAGTYRADNGQLNTVGNDNISSFNVPQGFKVRVCENESGGLCREYGPGEYSYVGDDLNDKISFIEVTQHVTVYQHSNFTGTSQSFTPGTYKSTQLNIVGNDAISSLRVPQGMVARVCTNSTGTGVCRQYTAGDHTYVGDDLNDKISYIQVK